MTQFYALTPKQAIKVIQAVGVDDAAKLIADHAAAGLVKSYAQIQVTINARGERTSVRGAAVEPTVWERMIRDGVDGGVWTGGTVRLAGSGLVGGEPAVHVTGFAFNPADVERLANQQRPTPRGLSTSTQVQPLAAEQLGASHNPESNCAPEPSRQSNGPDLSPLHSGALLLTVEQTKAALSISHTTFYKLLKAGELERAPSKAGTRVTVASVRRYAGLSG